MTIYDVFNGDADGICSLLQLRNATACQSELVTGIKRDIQLLSKVHASSGDKINVLDISLDKNRAELLKNLERGATVFYVDHHFCGELPENSHLSTLIDTQADICTSLLINQYLEAEADKQSFPLWAVAGAYGDNLNVSAQTLAEQHHLSVAQMEALKSLGIYINYNGYGASIEDLHFAPDALYKKLLPYQNPLDAIADKESVYKALESAYQADNAHIDALKADYETDQVAVFILPNQAWARRISGVYSNDLVNQFPDRAHAVLTQNEDHGYLVSVRAPLNNKTGADELCRQFEGGGGRKAAAGINHLPEADFSLFIKQLTEQFK